MPGRFFTADYHWWHNEIIEYAGRPFKNLLAMHYALRSGLCCVKDGDVCYHLGDLCLSSRSDLRAVLMSMPCRMEYIAGNHDVRNGFDGNRLAIQVLGGRKVLLAHAPPYMEDNYEGVDVSAFDAILCGHVHTAWAEALWNGKPIINVGVDVRGFKPMSALAVVKLMDRIERNKSKYEELTLCS